MSTESEKLAAAFSLPVALRCALACQAVYQSAAIVTPDAHANVTDDSRGNVTVALRGTANIRDLLTDLSAWRENIHGLDVHKGFYSSATRIGRQINEAIDAIQSRYVGFEKRTPLAQPQLPSPSPLLGENGNLAPAAVGFKVRVFVTGHSLGGAQAIFTAYRLRCMGYHVANVYTFGQPRVASSKFMASYDSFLGAATFRVTNGADIVPWLPWLLGAYRHGGIEQYLPRLGLGLIANPSLLRKLAFNGPELFREWRRRTLACLADHHLDNYLKSLGLLNLTSHQPAFL